MPCVRWNHSYTREIINVSLILLQKSLPNMKCFSLTSYSKTTAYDSQILPLIRQMTYLEELTLYISVRERLTFIDGTHLKNEIVVYMPRLQTFTFNIITCIRSRINQTNIQSNNDICRTFLNWQYGQVDCYIDNNSNRQDRSHIFSLPYTMTDIYGISNNFPDSLFTCVRTSFVADNVRPFEHEFFLRIARAFPLLTDLIVLNNIVSTNAKSLDSDDIKNQTMIIIEFPRLTSLAIHFNKVSYVEQFLVETNTYLPSLIKLTVSYKNLAIVTENFTRNSTHCNCSKIQTLKFTDMLFTVHLESFYLYFPSLTGNFR